MSIASQNPVALRTAGLAGLAVPGGGVAAEWNVMDALLLGLCVAAAYVPAAPESLFGVAELSLAALFVLLVLCGITRAIPRHVCRQEHAAQWAVVLLLCGWLTSAINVVLHDELTVDAYLRGLTPFLGVATFWAGRTFRSAGQACIVLLAFAVADFLIAFGGAGQALREGIVDHNDMSSSIQFRMLLDAKIYEALVAALPIALIGGGLVGRSQISWAFLLIGGLLFLFTLLTLMRSGVVMAVAAIAFEVAMIFRHPVLPWRFLSKVPAMIVLLAVVELASLVGSVGGFRVPSLIQAAASIGERHRTYERSESGEYRLMEATAAWERFCESPVFGHGLGASFSVSTYEGPVDRSAMRYTHNFFTYTLYTGGLVGIVAAAWFFIVALRMAYHVARHVGYSSEPAADMALALLTLAMLLYIQFQSMFRSSTYFMLVGLTVGCLAARASALTAAVRAAQGPSPGGGAILRRP